MRWDAAASGGGKTGWAQRLNDMVTDLKTGFERNTALQELHKTILVSGDAGNADLWEYIRGRSSNGRNGSEVVVRHVHRKPIGRRWPFPYGRFIGEVLQTKSRVIEDRVSGKPPC